jgi:hypothetical protein
VLLLVLLLRLLLLLLGVRLLLHAAAAAGAPRLLPHVRDKIAHRALDRLRAERVHEHDAAAAAVHVAVHGHLCDRLAQRALHALRAARVRQQHAAAIAHNLRLVRVVTCGSMRRSARARCWWQPGARAEACWGGASTRV